MSDNGNLGYSYNKVIRCLKYYKALLNNKIKCNVSENQVLALHEAYNILRNAKKYNSDVVNSAIGVFDRFERDNRYLCKINQNFNRKKKK